MENFLKQLTLKEKVAQLLCPHIKGIDYNEDDTDYIKIIKDIEEHQVGGIILFHGPLKSAMDLINTMQSKSKIPLLISSDIERGLGQIIKGGTEFPTNMAIAASHNPRLAYEHGYISAIEARLAGIHISYAPVADVNNNPDNPIINTRSYGEDPYLVASFVGQYIQGVQEAGALAAAKHFPGHGDTSEDSHAKLPILKIDKNRFNILESIPFKKAIQSNVDLIMSAHIAFPKITGEDYLPATLSKKILTGLLREELGFHGLIVSDALNMGGIRENFTEGEASVLALEAGVDILLYTEDVEGVINTIIKAIEDKRLTEERINQSLVKILDVKNRLGLFDNPLIDIKKSLENIKTEAHFEKALEVAQDSVTLISPDKYWEEFKSAHSIFTSRAGHPNLPLKQDDKINLLIIDEDESENVEEFLEREFNNRSDYFSIKDILTPSNCKGFDKSKINDDEILIIAIFSKIKAWKERSGLNASLLNLINEILKKYPNSLVLNFASPYIYNYLDQCKFFYCLYSFSEVSQIASVQALFDEIPVKGILPVSLNDFLLYTEVDAKELKRRSSFD